MLTRNLLTTHLFFIFINAQSLCIFQKVSYIQLVIFLRPHYFNDSLQAKAKTGKYLMEKYQSEQYLQLALKYFVKSFSISELLSKVSQIQTTIAWGTP